MSKRNFQTDVTIAGGGLNGPALALALAQAGLRVSLIDAQAPRARAQEGFDGRAYALAIASKNVLSAIGLWPQLADKVQPILEIRASEGHAGQGPAPFFLSFDSDEIEEGPMGYMLEDRHLYAALAQALEAHPRVAWQSGVKVTDHTSAASGVRVRLSSGQEIETAVLVGADGRGSSVAARAKIRRLGAGYGQTALVCAVEHTRAHAGVAQQFFMPAGPLAILPLHGGYRSSIVWSEESGLASEIAALDDANFLAALRPRFGDFLGEIRLAGARFSYPLSLSLAETFIAERVALIGDAAHGVHPVAGQGLNLGLRDVAALAEVLVAAHRRGEDIGQGVALEEYQRWRRFDATTLALGMDGITRLFSNDNPILRLGRNLGLGAVNALPPLRRHLLRQAAGLNGERPKLLRGQPL